jgi:FemAB-related protein (PEP-CTERM system-associated)
MTSREMGREQTPSLVAPVWTEPPEPGAAAPDLRARADNVTCAPATDADADEWNRFVASQPGANLGLLYEWRHVIAGPCRRKTHYLLAREGGQCAGILPLANMTGALGGRRLVSLPYLDQGGLLATSAEAAASLWNAATELATRLGSRGIDLRSAAVAGGSSSNCGRATLVLPLPPRPEDLWKSFSPKVRNQIRKSEKEGLKSEAAGPEALARFYEVFAQNMRDLGSPVHGLPFLEAVLSVFPEKARLYVTRDASDRVVGGAISIAFRDTITVPWASSLREVFHACPNHSLYWRILSDAAASGAARFDFGRSHEGSGTYRFKTQWGAEPCALAWSSFDARGIRQPVKVLKPSEHGAVTWAWQHLPVWIANKVGPVLRRQLAN